jgi:iron complex transport system ATP-binding protein
MTGRLEARRLSFAYRDRPVIRDLSADFAAGRFYGVLGPNGCGKSTLLLLLAGLLTPAGGTIRLDGRDLAACGRRELARIIALVPQDFHVRFPFSAEEIVLMGRYPHLPRFSAPGAAERRRVAAVMTRTDTAALGPRLVTELSGGERQRVVFARALAQETPVLLLDEATSNLDVHHSLALLRLATERVRQDRVTVIAVFQDINLAALFCDELLVLQDGTARAVGPVAEVLSPELLGEVFHVEAKVVHDSFYHAPHVLFRP